MGDSAVEVGVREEEEGVVEMKETKGDGVDDSNEATKTATATATLDTEASLGLTIAVDANTNAITNQSFFTAVIVPSCQPGNVVCSANQHRYIGKTTKLTLILTLIVTVILTLTLFNLTLVLTNANLDPHQNPT